MTPFPHGLNVIGLPTGQDDLPILSLHSGRLRGLFSCSSLPQAGSFPLTWRTTDMSKRLTCLSAAVWPHAGAGGAVVGGRGGRASGAAGSAQRPRPRALRGAPSLALMVAFPAHTTSLFLASAADVGERLWSRCLLMRELLAPIPCT